jgi:hypothetical protein
MFDRLHAYATKRKAPGWILITIVLVAIVYEIVDAVGNVEFVADNAGYLSWLRVLFLSPLGLLALMVVGFAWLLFIPESKPAKATGLGSLTAPDVPATPAALELSIAAPTGGDARTRIFNETHRDGDFVHVLVTNHGVADAFVAQVVDFKGITSSETQYFAKWRGHGGEDRRIYQDALIDLAQFTSPRDTTQRRPALGATLLQAAGIDTPPLSEDGLDSAWDSGYVRLFSANKPDGWIVYGYPRTSSLFGSKKPDPLEVFDVTIALKLRVTSARGLAIERWVVIEFLRPEWHYRNQYWMLKGCKVALAEAIPPEQIRV